MIEDNYRLNFSSSFYLTPPLPSGPVVHTALLTTLQSYYNPNCTGWGKSPFSSGFSFEGTVYIDPTKIRLLPYNDNDVYFDTIF